MEFKTYGKIINWSFKIFVPLFFLWIIYVGIIIAVDSLNVQEQKTQLCIDNGFEKHLRTIGYNSRDECIGYGYFKEFRFECISNGFPIRTTTCQILEVKD